MRVLLAILLAASAQTADPADGATRFLEKLQAGRDAYPALMRQLTDDPELDSTVAARALYARPRPAADGESLIRYLQSGGKARAAAAWELSRIGQAAGDRVVRALIEALQCPDKHERNFAVLALALDAPPGPAPVAPLLRVLRDPGVEAPPQRNYRYPRETAAVALGMLGPHAREAMPVLLRAADIAAARWAVRRIEASAADPLSDADVRAQARAISEGRRRIDMKSVDRLRDLGAFAGVAGPIRKKGKSALPVHESIALAIGYLDSLNPPPSLSRIVEEEAAGALGAETMRYIMALGGVQQGIARTLLKALEEGERDPRVRAVRRLGSMGAAAKEAIPVLRAATRDEDWIVRRAAAQALERVESAQLPRF